MLCVNTCPAPHLEVSSKSLHSGHYAALFSASDQTHCDWVSVAGCAQLVLSVHRTAEPVYGWRHVKLFTFRSKLCAQLVLSVHRTAEPVYGWRHVKLFTFRSKLCAQLVLSVHRTAQPVYGWRHVKLFTFRSKLCAHHAACMRHFTVSLYSKP